MTSPDGAGCQSKCSQFDVHVNQGGLRGEDEGLGTVEPRFSQISRELGKKSDSCTRQNRNSITVNLKELVVVLSQPANGDSGCFSNVHLTYSKLDGIFSRFCFAC